LAFPQEMHGYCAVDQGVMGGEGIVVCSGQGFVFELLYLENVRCNYKASTRGMYNLFQRFGVIPNPLIDCLQIFVNIFERLLDGVLEVRKTFIGKVVRRI